MANQIEKGQQEPTEMVFPGNDYEYFRAAWKVWTAKDPYADPSIFVSTGIDRGDSIEWKVRYEGKTPEALKSWQNLRAMTEYALWLKPQFPMPALTNLGGAEGLERRIRQYYYDKEIRKRR